MPNFLTPTFRRAPPEAAAVDVPTCPRTCGSRCRCVSRRSGRPWCPGRTSIAACTVVGRDVARDGAALGEALSGLRTTYARCPR